MATPEEQAQIDAAMQQFSAGQSPAMEHAVPTTPRGTSQDALQKAIEASGVDVEAIKREQAQGQAQQLGGRIDSVVQQTTDHAAKGGIVSGTLAGFHDIVRNTVNGIHSVANSLEDYAASKGVGSGDILDSADVMKNDYGADLDLSGKIARGVVNFAAPVAVTMATGGTFAAGLGAGALYDFLAVDPNQARLSDALKDTGLKEIPVVSDVISHLSHKPDDTMVDSRFKNLAEGLGMGAAVGSLFWAASRTYSGLKALRNPQLVKDAEQGVADLKNVQLQPEAQLAAQEAGYGQPASASPAEPAPVTPEVQAAADAHIAQNSKESSDLLATLRTDEPGTAFHPVDGAKVNLADDASLNTFYNAMQNNMNRQMLLAPTSDKELAQAALIMKDKPEVLASLANYDPKAASLTDEQTLVMKYLMGTADKEIGDSAAKAMVGSDADILKFSRDFENYSRFQDIKQGTASAKGKALRAEKVLGALAGLGDQQALEAIGAQGRAKLVNGLIEQYGGKENVKEMAQNVTFIKQLSDVSSIPNTDFTSRMGEVMKYGKWNKFEDAVTKVALNGMLSSPMTPMKAAITNAVTTGKTIIDNYVSVGLGSVLRSTDSRTLTEANAHLAASFYGLFEAIAPASKSILTGIPEDAKLMRLDIAEASKKFVPQAEEDLLETAGGAWSAKGVVLNAVDTAIDTPRRVLMGVDSYWQQVNKQGVLASEGARDGVKRGLQGEELANHIESFVQKPTMASLQRADETAATNTMAKGLTGWAEKLDDVIQNAPIPFKKVLLPFMKTNLNIIEYQLKNSPLAPFYPEVREALAAGGRSRDEALAKMVSGTAALSGLTWLAHQGLVNGPGSDNPEFNRAMKDNKTVPLETSIKTGNTWISLRGLEPLATAVNLAGLLSKASGYVQDKEYDDAVQATRAMISTAFTPEQLTTGLSDVINVINGKSNAKDYIAQVATRFTPFGAAVNDVRQTVDPTIRDVKGEKTMDPHAAGLSEFYEVLKNRFKNQVPYLSKDLPASRNFWGEKLEMPDGLGPDAISPFAATDDKGVAMKNALEQMDNFYELHKDIGNGLYKFNVAMPPRYIDNPMAPGAQYQLSPREYSAYMLLNGGINPTDGNKYIGKTLKESTHEILTQFDAFNKKPQDYEPAQYAALVGTLSKTFSMYRSTASKMIMQFGDVQRKMLDQATKYKQFQQITGGNGVSQ